MNQRQLKKAIDYDSLKQFEQEYEYKYQRHLTPILDRIGREQLFDRSIMFKIHLWKLNRYAEFNDQAIRELNKLRTLKKGQHRKGAKALELLLKINGVDIPLASTFLRFRNPEVFQIIDQRAYRATYGKRYRYWNRTKSRSVIEQKISMYFDYLDELHRLCDQRSTEFRSADRLLYIFDKKVNGKM
jgi:thermostable 8-oxoguanine DNA glycosylase